MCRTGECPLTGRGRKPGTGAPVALQEGEVLLLLGLGRHDHRLGLVLLVVAGLVLLILRSAALLSLFCSSGPFASAFLASGLFASFAASFAAMPRSGPAPRSIGGPQGNRRSRRPVPKRPAAQSPAAPRRLVGEARQFEAQFLIV